MGFADSSEQSETISPHAGGVQSLVRRLQVSPPAEFYITGTSPVSQKSLPDFRQNSKNITQIRAAINFKNTEISERFATFPRNLSTFPHQKLGSKVTLSDGFYGSPRGASLDESLAEDLVNILVRPDAPLEAERSSWLMLPLLPFHFIGGWIKHILWLSARVFPWKYPRVSPNNVLSSEAVQLAINKTCEREAAWDHAISEVVSKNARVTQTCRARHILDEMAANTSEIILRIAAIVVNKIFLSCLSGIHVRRDQLAELRSLSLANPGIPVVYLPLHRSHLDYILITYALWLHDMRLPQVAAGDNIALPGFSSLLRGLGAFFIRRRIDQDSHSKRVPKDQRGLPSKDYVYRGVLQEYVCELLSMGHSLEFYMEGGRSRSGRTLPAKAGLLAVLVHAYQRKTVKDIIIVPGAVTYDKLLDGSFVAEQLGLPKVKETFGGAMRSIWGVMCSKFGSVRIEFGRPFSLKAFLRENAELFDLDEEFDSDGSDTDRSLSDNISPVRTCSSASLVNTANEDQQKMNKLTHCLATRILCASTAAQALSGPSLVAFLMMTQFRSGCRESTLTSSLVELCHLLRAPPNVRSLMLNPFNENTCGLLFKYTQWLFPDLFASRSCTTDTEHDESLSSSDDDDVDQEQVFYAQVNGLDTTLQLQYIANPVVEALLGEAILATALLAARSERERPPLVEDREKSSQFVPPPNCDENLNDEDETCSINWSLVEQVVAELCDILEFEFVYLQDPQQTLQTIEDAKAVFVKERLLFSATGVDVPTIRCDPQSIQRLVNLRSSIAHLIEGYHTVAVLMRDLQTNSPRLCDRCLASECLRKALAKCEKGLIEYPEGCAKDIIQNAVKLFVRWGVLESIHPHADLPSNGKLRRVGPSGQFYVGEQSNVESAESSSSSSSESLDSDLCVATKCISVSAGVDAYRVKISDEWIGNLDRLTLKFERFRTPPECE